MIASGCCWNAVPAVKYHRLLIAVVFILFSLKPYRLVAADSKPAHTLEPIVVIGSRLPQEMSKTGRSITIINREAIENAPADNVADLLEYVSGVDVRQRGGHGIQGDISIRGGGFEQVLVLMDGISLNDPQTGHHNLDIPIDLNEIERIEILKGPGARAYGQNAMTGVIRIVTRKPPEGVDVGGHGAVGDYGYYDVGAHADAGATALSHSISASRRSSDGHIKDEETDFEIDTFSYKTHATTGETAWTSGVGYTNKDFGAYRFYSDTYPDQREHTETWLVHTSADLSTENMELTPKVSWRRHNDDYKILVGGNWLENEHETDTFGAQLDTRLDSKWGTTGFGAESVFDVMESSNLGDHHRRRSGTFFEHQLSYPPSVTYGFGLSAAYYTDWDWELSPGGEVSVELAKGTTWFASSGKSFRVPTFTELYYDTPGNQGNPSLNPEEAWSYETGPRWFGKGASAQGSVFLRDEKNLIDWSRSSSQEPWKARNIADSQTQGFELGCTLNPNILLGIASFSSLNVAYTYLHSDRDIGGMESKYALDHLRHQIHASADFEWMDCVRYTVKARYEERVVGDSHIVVDTGLTYRWGKVETFVEAANLFDEDYIDAGFAPMPGRWVMGGIRFRGL